MPRVPRSKTASDTTEPKRPRRTAVKTTASVTPISAAEIAAEAYALFLARGGQHGDALADWLTAERLVMERRMNG